VVVGGVNVVIEAAARLVLDRHSDRATRNHRDSDRAARVDGDCKCSSARLARFARFAVPRALACNRGRRRGSLGSLRACSSLSHLVDRIHRTHAHARDDTVASEPSGAG
jgi:hypothetical protein